MKHYIALIRKEKGSCYGVDFPDFPGCITAADTVEEAQALAVEVIDLHVEGMIEDGIALPVATRLDDILKDPDNHDGLVLAVQVPLADKKTKKVRVDITIPEDLSRQVDRHVNLTEEANPSAFFPHAAMLHLQRTAPPPGFGQVMVRAHKRSAIKATKKATGAKTVQGVGSASKKITKKKIKKKKVIFKYFVKGFSIEPSVTLVQDKLNPKIEVIHENIQDNPINILI